MLRVTIQYYERKSDFETDYWKPHMEYITGKNAADCMRQHMERGKTHDIARYTPREIIHIQDI